MAAREGGGSHVHLHLKATCRWPVHSSIKESSRPACYEALVHSLQRWQWSSAAPGLLKEMSASVVQSTNPQVPGTCNMPPNLTCLVWEGTSRGQQYARWFSQLEDRRLVSIYRLPFLRSGLLEERAASSSLKRQDLEELMSYRGNTFSTYCTVYGTYPISCRSSCRLELCLPIFFSPKRETFGFCSDGNCCLLALSRLERIGRLAVLGVCLRASVCLSLVARPCAFYFIFLISLSVGERVESTHAHLT
ncbi:hypothetical protein B0T26DRAFT_222602 [Lasiosphaeria miniovina]|uniref:Uncharacterized protein n=1 Tax=Lasiosphaeria miniovina TaxID=1954250 RepID=A0AA40AV36_9PEZI|nr:uncharacterized protein B0T26DRAFT_222602 [Lasiosphaeria miniovina]KAK0722501.1 hypothetical protein B0T26DRAFT_222602 [Lasiosphaeria miniovina]